MTSTLGRRGELPGLEMFRDFLLGWKSANAEDFPMREDFKQFQHLQCEQGTWEVFMLAMLDAGIVGMDGFKYCWPEEAKESWARLHSPKKVA